MRSKLGSLISALVLIGAGISQASAADTTSTPAPGGAYELRGMTGAMRSTLFNGKIRIKGMKFRTATSKELILEPGERGIVFSCIVSNGTDERRSGYLGASLVDADGIVLNSYGDPEESIYSLDPGAAARQSIRFLLKAGFQPVEIIVVERGNGPQPVFRITVKPADLP